MTQVTNIPKFTGGVITKIDEDRHLVFGFFSVIEENGVQVVDKQGDIIDEEELEEAAYGFVINARIAGEMHEKRGVGELVESMVFTKAKQKALGIDLNKVGWFGGFRISDEEVWKKIKSGEYPAFSIGGIGEREEVV